jgi:hypothetical protein
VQAKSFAAFQCFFYVESFSIVLNFKPKCFARILDAHFYGFCFGVFQGIGQAFLYDAEQLQFCGFGKCVLVIYFMRNKHGFMEHKLLAEGFETEAKPDFVEHDRVQVAADLADAVDDAVDFVTNFRSGEFFPDALFEQEQIVTHAVVQVNGDSAPVVFDTCSRSWRVNCA